MAYIGHRCTNCSHRRGEHQGPDDKPTSCRQTFTCTCRGYAEGPPELIPTIARSGKPVDTVTVPGELITAGLRSCGCDGCQALHTKLAA